MGVALRIWISDLACSLQMKQGPPMPAPEARCVRAQAARPILVLRLRGSLTLLSWPSVAQSAMYDRSRFSPHSRGERNGRTFFLEFLGE